MGANRGTPHHGPQCGATHHWQAAANAWQPHASKHNVFARCMPICLQDPASSGSSVYLNLRGVKGLLAPLRAPFNKTDECGLAALAQA